MTRPPRISWGPWSSSSDRQTQKCWSNIGPCVNITFVHVFHRRGRNPGNDNKKETVNKSYHQKKLSRKGSLEERAKRRGTVNSNQSSNINNNNLNKSLSNSLTGDRGCILNRSITERLAGLKTLNKTQLEKKIANRKQTQKRKFRSNENLDLCQQQQPPDFKETLRFRNFSRQKSVSTSQDSLIYGHIQSGEAGSELWGRIDDSR